MAARKTFVILLLVALQLYSVVSQGVTTDTSFETSITTSGNPTVTDGTALGSTADPTVTDGTALGTETDPSVTDGTALASTAGPTVTDGTALGTETDPSVTDGTTLKPVTGPPTPPPTTTTICRYPDQIDLFNNGRCMPRSAYTGIFLSSIILAGISFLMLIGLLILVCTKRSGHSGSGYNDYESSGGSEQGSMSTILPAKRINDSKPHPGRQNKQASQNAPYTPAKPVEKPTVTAHQKDVGKNQSRSRDAPSKPPVNGSRAQPGTRDGHGARNAKLNGRRSDRDGNNDTSF
ncbi:unnamed protein product [Rotaria socialis]|uniref:Uncharacterized protein n=1 Tax=Rotaria socialis TaxID=392032 RepID=A0A820CW03_9BILA|nr:unnamed protein product [Rotaria socialis]